MAKSKSNVLLAFEDECITEKHKHLLNCTLNKIGGIPDWPVEGIKNPSCQLCGLTLPLVVQIYAPLDISPYHRTLYLFACINPNCWNQQESWVCIRSQILEEVDDKSLKKKPSKTVDWGLNADDWDDDNNFNNDEQNGNVINRIESIQPNSMATSMESVSESLSDDDEEANPFNLEQYNKSQILNKFEKLSVDEKNANIAVGEVDPRPAGAGDVGAVGRLHPPTATAELEGDEGEVITIDTPTMPQVDLSALLQEATPIPLELVDSKDHPSPYFNPSFITVAEEDLSSNTALDHVREVFQEYQNSSDNPHFSQDHSQANAHEEDEHSLEKYETSIPLHGDTMFYHFLSRIHYNPGQILRYSRDADGPLFLSPAPKIPGLCSYCREPTQFEMQLLPTIIPKLTLFNTGASTSYGQTSSSVHLEFGTALVYTCSASCWSPGDKFRIERVLIQAEQNAF